MTPPRRVLPGTVYLVTRRCSERRYFLRPSRLGNDVFLYVLAVAADRFGVLVHAFCVLSNHCHLVVTDTHANLPAFMQFLDSLVARALNAALGRFEAFWATDGSYSAVQPLGPEDVVSKTAYLLANPVGAGLVRSARDWPGLWSAPERFGSRLRARRPSHFFDPKGPLPESVELELAPPAGFDTDRFRDQVAAALREREEAHRRTIESNAGRFLGAARVLAQNPFACPRTPAPRFGLVPRIAARDRSTRLEGILRLKSFLTAYRRAWEQRKAGLPDVLFPPGTYLLRILHGVRCAGTA